MAQRGRGVPGAGEPAAQRRRVIHRVQAGGADLVAVPGDHAAELLHDLLGPAAQAGQGRGGGAQLAHDRRGVDAVAGHVADHQRSPAAPVSAAGASRAGPRRGGCLPARDRGGRAGPCQSSAGCQSTGGGSEPCLMMLAYTPSSASLSGPTSPAASPPKNRRPTTSPCPRAPSSPPPPPTPAP